MPATLLILAVLLPVTILLILNHRVKEGERGQTRKHEKKRIEAGDQSRIIRIYEEGLERIKSPPPLPVQAKSNRQPFAPPSSKTSLEWIPFNQPTRIQGYTTNGGFYAVRDITNEEIEPSSITLNDKVANPEPPDHFSSSYYPAYAYLTPAEKASYLYWLQEGRTDLNPEKRNHGYLFIYFYGLERRALYEKKDIPEVIRAGMHLLATYGTTKPKRSFVSYSSELLHFLGTRLTDESYRQLWPRLLPLHPEKVTENVLTLITGNLARLGESLPAEIAYLIAERHDDSRRSVVIRRTAAKFRKLFEAKFNQHFTAGFTLKVSKREKIVTYQTANASLTPRLMMGPLPQDFFQASIPNVFGIKSQFHKLPEIWNECIDELSGYSRTVQRLSQSHAASEQEKLAAWLQLPTELKNPQDCPLYPSFQSLLADTSPGEAFATIPCKALCVLLNIHERTTLTAKQTSLLTDLASSLGHSISPNPLLLNIPLRWNQPVCLHTQPLDLNRDHLSLIGLLKLLYLNILMAAADGEVSEGELEFFHKARATAELSPSQNMELDATKAALLADTSIALKNLSRLTKSVPSENRPGVFHYLIRVAAADEIITSDERSLLLRIQKAFELPEHTLEEALADDLEFRTVQVTAGKKKSKGDPIPPRPQTEANKPEFSLDSERIEKLTQETKEVVAALSSLFDEPEETIDEEAQIEASQEAGLQFPSWMNELSPSLAKPLLELLAIKSPSCMDLEKVASSHHLMAGAFCDEVNEWSDDALGDFLLEMNPDGSLSIYRGLLPSD